MSGMFLITAVVFDFVVSFFVGLLVWIIFKRRLSPAVACAVIVSICALLIGLAYPIAGASGGGGTVGLIANFLLCPFAMASLGASFALPVEFLCQVATMAFVGYFVWRRENRRTGN